MITQSEINRELHRPLFAGKKYDKLIPPADGIEIPLAVGDTQIAIAKMVDWALSHKKDTARIAPLLRGTNLATTCRNIHYFLYNHIQYKLDGVKQQLRSPASVWGNRHEGTDCKSYSIFGSTILQNLNIPHYFRRIKQTNINPEAFTHVYIVVPKNGKNTNNGYFVIDGTIPVGTGELSFSEKDDIGVVAKQTALGGPAVAKSLSKKSKKIQQLGHRRLQKLIDALKLQQPHNTDLDELQLHIESLLLQGERVTYSATATTITLNGKTYQLHKNGMGAIVTTVTVCIAVVELLINLYMTFIYDPCAGAFYVPEHIQADFQKKFMPKMKELLEDLGTALKYNNHIEVQHRFNYLFKEVGLGVAHYLHECSVHDGNDCSKATLNSPELKSTILGIRDSIENAYKDWKSQNSQFEVTEYFPTANMGDRTLWFVVPNSINNISAEYRQIKISDGQERPVKPVYPYEYDMDKWLRENTIYLQTTYSHNVAMNYKKEVLPILSKIKAIRNDLSLYSYERHDFEKKHQAKLYKIYIKYDTKYTQEIKRDATIARNANALANVEFKKKLEKLIREEQAKKAERLENLKLIKKHEQKSMFTKLGLMGAGTLAVLFTIKDEPKTLKNAV